jgi:4-carboxymuconolactone decarboxylase
MIEQRLIDFSEGFIIESRQVDIVDFRAQRASHGRNPKGFKIMLNCLRLNHGAIMPKKAAAATPTGYSDFKSNDLKRPRKKDTHMTTIPQSNDREKVRNFVPKLAEISEQVVYGDMWQRPGLTRRERSLITLAALLAMGHEKQFRNHVTRGIDNGVTEEEIGEMITHLALYAGIPASMTAALAATDVLGDSA